MPDSPNPDDPNEPDRNERDQPIYTDLMINESKIRSQLFQDHLLVKIPITSNANVELSGLISLELLDLRQEEDQVIGQEEVEFSINNEQETIVEVRLNEGVSFENPSDLVNYVLRWGARIDRGEEGTEEESGTEDEEVLWGRRSLYTTYDYTEIQWVGTSEVLQGKSHLLRFIARSSEESMLPPNVQVNIKAVRQLESEEASEGDESDEEERTTLLFEGVSDESGSLDIELATEALEIGHYDLVMRWRAPEGEQQYVKSIRVSRPSRVLLTTDKPIYQPNQKIHIRALALIAGGLQPIAQEMMKIEVYDGKDNLVERFEVQTNDFGVASATFKLAREVNMGSYRLVSYLGDTTVEKQVTVDRYALPKFDLDIQLSQDIYLAGDELSGSLNAQYFFGESVSGAQVRIQASTLDAGSTLFHESTGLTNEEGLFSFSFTLPEYVVGLPLEQGGGLIDLSIEVIDTAGQSRGVSKTLRIAPAALSVSAVSDFGRWIHNVQNRLLLRSVGPNGQGVSTSHILTLGMETFELESDAYGVAVFEITPDEETPNLEIVSRDADGNEVNTVVQFNQNQETTTSIAVRTSQSMYRVGDRLRAEIMTFGISDRVYVDVLHQGRSVYTDTLSASDTGVTSWELDLTPDFAGTLQLSVYTLSQSSSLRRHSVWVHVEDVNHLQIEMSTDREVYAPGESATLAFQVRDEEGRGLPVALGFQIVDEAVFSLMEFRPGLEREYFRFEAELSKPRYQIGVRGLPQLTSSSDSIDHPENQGEAQLLFANTPSSARYDLLYNNAAYAKAQAPVIARSIFQRVSQALQLELIAESQQKNWTSDQDVQSYLLAHPLIDPWGQQVEIEFSYLLKLTTAGPDELFDTEDDITQTLDVQCDILEGCPEEFIGDLAAAEDGAPQADEESESESGGGGGSPRIRKRFPETLWVEPALITDERGQAQVEIPLADSITTWRVSTMGNSQGGLLGSSTSGILVSQDFFVDIDFPATLTRGDEYTLPIAIYNYLDDPQTISLQIESGDWISLLGEANQEVVLAPGEVRGVALPVRVEKVGLHSLRVFAYGDVLSDAVERQVLVVPDGKKIENIASGMIEGLIRERVSFPQDAIEGSGKLLVKIFPNLLASVIEGLEGILQMPSGCFEQTSSSTWPNVLVARYLDESNLDSPEIMLQANEYINTGYQRLLTFEVTGGGFEWFGQTPAHEVLTAYGLLEFVDMAEVRSVDADMISRTRAWLLGRQQADGGWTVSSRGLDETGQLNDPVTVTAYIAFALAAAGEDGDSMGRALNYLSTHEDEMGTYTLSLYANFLVAYEPNSNHTQSILSRLSDLIDTDLGDHWETTEQTTTYGNGTPAFIETTALATHALLSAQSNPQTTQKALAWLSSQRTTNGGWGSTAGTVWTIKSLLQAARQSGDQEVNGVVRVLLDGAEVSQFEIDSSNSDIIRQADLGEQVNLGTDQLVEIELEGMGTMQYSVTSSYHVPWTEGEEDGPFRIEVLYDRTQLEVDDLLNVTVTAHNNDILYADMVMLDLGIPPGFELVRDDLNALVEEGVIERYESTERQLLLYVRQILPDQPLTLEYHLVARNPIRAQAPSSRVYSYYNQEVEEESESVEIEVR